MHRLNLLEYLVKRGVATLLLDLSKPEFFLFGRVKIELKGYISVIFEAAKEATTNCLDEFHVDAFQSV